MTYKSTTNKKLIWSVGINDSNYKITSDEDGKRKVCPYYSRWYHILRRCYDKKFHQYNPCYKNCYVADEWKLFSNFKLWMESQDWKGNELDKDLLIPGNKIYGPDTCIFVSHKVNSFLTIGTSKYNKYPLGCHYKKSTGKFYSRIEVDNTKIILGIFDTPIEAHRKWQLKKIECINSIINELTDNIKLKHSLTRIANKMYSDYSNNLETKILI